MISDLSPLTIMHSHVIYRGSKLSNFKGKIGKTIKLLLQKNEVPTLTAISHVKTLEP